MPTTDWPEIFPTVNQPDHAEHLDWTFACGVTGCQWVTYHQTERGARGERDRHHYNETCPYTRSESHMARGKNIISKLWDRLDACTKNIMESKAHFSEYNDDQLEGYYRVCGEATGLAVAIYELSVPHFEDPKAVSRWAVQRLKMANGEREFEDTPGVDGYNPMPASTPRAEPKKRVGITGVKSSSPKDSPSYGKFKQLTDSEVDKINKMYGKFPDAQVMSIFGITQEQLNAVIAKAPA